jgi:hypothetical protein
VSVVPAEVAGESAGAVGAGVVGEAVGRFALECLDRRFRFPVGLRPPRPRVAVGDSEVFAGCAPEAGAVSVSVVREDPFGDDPLLAEAADGAAEEGRAGGRRFAPE